MSTAPFTEPTAAAVIPLIEAGTYPRDVVMTIAQGYLPLPQEELISVLAYLSASNDREVGALARTALGEIPTRVVLDYAANEGIPVERLVDLMNATSDSPVLELLIRNRTVPDSAVTELARRAEGRLQEVIVINQARILRAPQILDALLENPALSADAKRRALETREEFFDKRARMQPMEAVVAELEEELADIPLEPIADLLERAAAEPPPEAAEQTLSLLEGEKKDTRKFAIWAKLQYLSVSEKVQLSFKGDRMLRMLLVRDRNRLICTAVMRNPRITETEIESIAGMRNVEPEVLRLIGAKKDWSGKYNIMLILCKNPKTPVGVVLPFINRLILRDLKGLKDDKGVQQVVREMAKKLYLSRTQKTG
ncbi:MAG TPA: hypothetical protein VNA69_05300 [Thermoanaerobaculia bacterium]|nr:hypothetical protein [Thermoanaerobaculia bacterium]